MNLTLIEAKVRSFCDKSGVSISAIEPLPDGGCHLVCTTADGAEEIRTKLKKYVIEGRMRRTKFYRA
jgi:hypothetical protein